MDHVNVNRFALSALGAVLFVMLLTAFSNLVLSPRTPKVPGFALPTSGPATEAAAGPAEPEAPPLPTLLAKADATKGAQFAKVCQTCHNFEKGAGAKIGPPLYGRRRPADRLGPRLRLFRFAQSGRRKLDLRSPQRDGQQPEEGSVRHQDDVPGRERPTEAS